jgi:hypothetical protein
MQRYVNLIVIVVGVFLSPILGISTMTDEDPKALPFLRGLNAVHVQVKDIDPELGNELRRAGLVEDQVQIAVERRLEKAGIIVQTDEQCRKSAVKAVLVIKLELLLPEAVEKVRYTLTEEGERVRKPPEDPKYAYRTDVVLRQNVSLVRETAIQGMAITWSAGSVGYRRLIRVQADLMDQVNKFIDAYKAANLG